MKNKGVLLQTTEKPRALSVEDLRRITDDFSEKRIIGSGGYGVVYEGELDGEKVAVKKLRNLQWLGDDQFNECINLMGAQHQNIVRLIGYCYQTAKIISEYDGKHVFAEDEVRALCLEYLQGGSLDAHLSEDEPCQLDWCKCYGIIKGISEGLKYLHAGSRKPIFHLDLKPANILLDKDDIPKIGDFGLSRLGSTQTCVSKEAMGTFGYMPPEYIHNHKITSKFDVFSLGVIILEIVAGRSLSYQCAEMASKEFIKLVHEKWEKRLEATVPSSTSCEVRTCIRIALRCVDKDRAKRPTIAEIVDKLNKIDISKSSSTCEIIDFGSEQDSDERCASSENCGVTILVPNEAAEVPGAQPMLGILDKDGEERQARSRAKKLDTPASEGSLLDKAVQLTKTIISDPTENSGVSTILLRNEADEVHRTQSVVGILSKVGEETHATSRMNNPYNPASQGTVMDKAVELTKKIYSGYQAMPLRLPRPLTNLGRYVDGCCSQLRAQLRKRRWLILLPICLGVAAVLVATVILVLRFAVVAKVNADIEDARLNTFALSTMPTDAAGTPSLTYSMTVAISIGNPNMAMSITYSKPLVAAIVFDGQRLYNATFTYEGQKHRPGRTGVYLLHPAGVVPSHSLGDAAVIEEFKKQNATGVFNLEVRVTGEVTLGLGNSRMVSLSCPLSLWLAPVAATFNMVNCVPMEPEGNYF